MEINGLLTPLIGSRGNPPTLTGQCGRQSIKVHDTKDVCLKMWTSIDVPDLHLNSVSVDTLGKGNYEYTKYGDGS